MEATLPSWLLIAAALASVLLAGGAVVALALLLTGRQSRSEPPD
jgi:hypothetical protein